MSNFIDSSTFHLKEVSVVKDMALGGELTQGYEKLTAEEMRQLIPMQDMDKFKEFNQLYGGRRYSNEPYLFLNKTTALDKE